MAVLAVNPNRMELLKLKNRRKIATKGHKLLRDKQEELVRRFLDFIRDYGDLRKQIEQRMREMYRLFLSARGRTTQQVWSHGVSFAPQDLSLKVNEKKMMNISFVKFEVENIPSVIQSGAQVDADMTTGLVALKNLLPDLLKLAEQELAIKQLADEIEKTRRRVNALEYILIPSLDETICFITMRLGELERATRTQLMRIKDIVGE